MKGLKSFISFLFFVFAIHFSYSQQKEIDEFEKWKGKLSFPVCNMYGYNDLNCEDHLSGCPQVDYITFITDSCAEVRSVCKGEVFAVNDLGDECAVTIKNNAYFITYSSLSKPELKKGDKIVQGQVIANISDSYNPCEVTIIFYTETKYIDPYKLFRW